MSTTEILAQLPALPPDDLETIWQTAGKLLEGRSLTASPELLAEVDEADASWEKEGAISIEDARRTIGPCPGK
jgi:hypothetical protein